jgi:hypothetical protein
MQANGLTKDIYVLHRDTATDTPKDS